MDANIAFRVVVITVYCLMVGHPAFAFGTERIKGSSLAEDTHELRSLDASENRQASSVQ